MRKIIVFLLSLSLALSSFVTIPASAEIADPDNLAQEEIIPDNQPITVEDVTPGEASYTDEELDEIAESDEYIASRLNVQFDHIATGSEVEALAVEFGGKVVSKSDFSFGTFACYSVNNSAEVSKTLQDREGLVFAEPDIELAPAVTYTTRISDDANTTSQYYMDNLHIEDAWDIVKAHRKATIAVAVVDTGCARMPELTAGNVNFSSSHANNLDSSMNDYSPNTDDSCFHGSAVCSIIGAQSNNKQLIAGVAAGWDNNIVRILPFACPELKSNAKLLDTASLCEAIIGAADNGVRVINCSYGAYQSSKTKSMAIKYATLRDCIVVCSAGNDGEDGEPTPQYPADYPGVIKVFATDRNNKRASFSSICDTNCASMLGISAPGSAVAVLQPDLETATYTDADGEKHTIRRAVSGTQHLDMLDGTSFSAPIVTSTIAMMLSVNPDLSRKDVADILAQTADNIICTDTPKKNTHSLKQRR